MSDLIDTITDALVRASGDPEMKDCDTAVKIVITEIEKDNIIIPKNAGFFYHRGVLGQRKTHEGEDYIVAINTDADVIISSMGNIEHEFYKMIDDYLDDENCRTSKAEALLEYEKHNATKRTKP